MNINTNKGMYIEELINRTIDYYWYNDVETYIEKRFVPIKIIKKINDSTFIGKLLAKSTVDYTGIHKLKHIEFEVKQTEKPFFDLSLIKKHQLMFLQKMNKLKVFCFLIIYFSFYDKILLVPYSSLENYINSKNKNKINFNFLILISYELKIIYPGILNLTEVINKIID